jgi:hypothetical protein
MSTEIEGHSNVQRIVVKDSKQLQGIPIWVSDQPVLIEHGRIKFFLPEIGCMFDIPVKQSKGQGAYYVHDWKKLPNNVMKIMAWWIAQDQEFVESYHKAEELLVMYQNYQRNKKNKVTTSGDWAGRMSELRGLKLLFENPDAGDEFKLDYSRSRLLLSNGGKL